MDTETPTLEELANHEDSYIAGVAGEILSYKHKLDDGELTKEQFVELSNDLLELQEIRKLTTTLERKTMLLQTLTTIKNIVIAVGGIVI